MRKAPAFSPDAPVRRLHGRRAAGKAPGRGGPRRITARDALAAVLSTERGMPVRPLGFPIAAFLECHIEQGPKLEEAGVPVGIVTGIQGSRWFAIEVQGDEAHAGTTPRRYRRDALSAAIAMVAALERLMFDEEDKVRFTVGRFEVSPDRPTRFPAASSSPSISAIRRHPP